MTGPVGVGVIGAGVISGQYLENLTRFPDVTVRFVADLDLARAADQADRFAIGSSGAVEELLDRDDVEIVLNLTIPAAHVEVGTRILEAGKHVWAEKPFALDRSSGLGLLDTAERLGLRIASAPDTFLGAGMQTTQRLVGEGAIGTPLNALAIMQSPGPESWHPNPEFLFDTGAGPLFDIGPYYVTALVQQFGPVAQVTAASSKARQRRVVASGPRAGTEFPVVVPTQHSALIEFESGATAQTIFSFEAFQPRLGFLELYGSEGTLIAPDPNRFDGACRLWQAGDETARVIPAAGSTFSRGTGVVEFARAIRAGVPERASGRVAFHVLDVLIAIAESAENSRTTTVSSTIDRFPPLAVEWDPSSPTL